MMKYIYFCLILSVFNSFSNAQFTDDFSDGDFLNNPPWSGDVADFIVNSSERVQLDASSPQDAYLSAVHGLSQLTDREWRFTIQYNFSPSGSNGGETYLTAVSPDLSTSPDGIYFRIGETGSNDPIKLIERNGGVETTILSSTPAIVASAFEISVKIIHRSNGDWELYTDLAGGSAFTLDNTVNYPTGLTGQYIGWWLEYTSSNVQNFEYDNIYTGPIQVDLTPPEILRTTAISANQIEVLFDETIDELSGETLNNYSVNQGVGNPTNAEQSSINLGLFTLDFASNFPVGDTLELTVNGVEDLEGNTAFNLTDTFQYLVSEIPDFGDIIINEIMPDESPVVGLPETQYVELFNRSDKYFNLDGWKLSDNNSSGTVQNKWLFPGEYLILVPTSGLPSYPDGINVTSWASLNNAGDDVRLSTPNGVTIDEVTYSDEWYQDPSKEDGGWSLERINPELACSNNENWTVSNHPSGGTPGLVNSVIDFTPDTNAPLLTSLLAGAPNFLTLTFSESVDSLSLSNALATFSPSLAIQERFISSAFPSEMVISFTEDLIAGQVYQFTLEGIEDCAGNVLNINRSFVLPQVPSLGDIQINEILFNPVTSGSDFIELYNTSDKFIDLKDWWIANYDDDTISNVRTLPQPFIMSPASYAVITIDSNFQIMEYPFAVPGSFIELESMPRYNNDSSTVYLGYFDQLMDKLSYTEDWHFELLQSNDGVSLERFNFDLATNDSSNWHSASETVGFATPGGENSQRVQLGKPDGELSLSSSSFSPDGDGFQDALLITYEVTEPELLGDLIVYDDKGRLIKTLMDDQLLGVSGSIKWDGTTDDGKKASIGPHIMYFSIFSIDQGSTQVIRKVVTVAGQL
jgi:hypothetical protein